MLCVFPSSPLNNTNKATVTLVRFTTTTCKRMYVIFGLAQSRTATPYKLYNYIRKWEIVITCTCIAMARLVIFGALTFTQLGYKARTPFCNSITIHQRAVSLVRRCRSVCDNRANIVLLQSAVSIFDMPCLDSLHKQTLAYTAKIANDCHSSKVMSNFCYPLVPGLTIATSSGS